MPLVKNLNFTIIKAITRRKYHRHNSELHDINSNPSISTTKYTARELPFSDIPYPVTEYSLLRAQWKVFQLEH